MNIEKEIEKLETQALSLWEMAVALRKELSGGSEGSKLTQKQKKRLIANRRNKLIG